jgi:glutaredoxin 2
LPEGEYSDELRYAAVSEKRRREIQSALDKSQHTLKTIEAEKEALKKKFKGKAQITLSAEETEELEELKFSDPDAWRVKMNEFETRAANEYQTELAEVSKEVEFQSELARREQVLDQFNTENPDFQITEEVVANDIPPRITNKLKEGKITFEDFLVEAKTYLSKGKTVHMEKTPGQPDLGKLGGSDKASASAVAGDIAASYNAEVF